MQVFALGILVVQIADRDGHPELAPFYLGLQSAAFNGAAIIGPLIAGVLFIPIGIGGLLLLNAVSFVAVLGALFVVPRVPPAARPAHGIFRSIAQGARYIKADPVLTWII